MRWFLNITTIVVATAVLFTQSHAAPIIADYSILPQPYSLGQVQQHPVPDPGIGDWISSIYSVIVKVIAKAIHNDRDPKKIEALKDYIKQTRAFVSPALDFIQRYTDPDDVATKNILKAVNTYLSSLDKLTEEPSASHVDIDMESVATSKLMRMLEAVES